eukprot:14479943-Alexandrium_andersonii.AAC.1
MASGVRTLNRAAPETSNTWSAELPRSALCAVLGAESDGGDWRRPGGRAAPKSKAVRTPIRR